MLKKRFIAVLIINGQNVVQSVRFKHTNAIHYNAVHAIECFNKWAVDEIVILNVSREKSSKFEFLKTIREICKKCHVPVSVGGWIDDPEYAKDLFFCGADKIVLNTAFHTDPELCINLSTRFGKQSIVGSIDIKKTDKKTHAWINRGTKNTLKDPETWAKNIEGLGAGEIFFNSIDHDGARRGYDTNTLHLICKAVSIPVIAFGGVFNWQHLVEGFEYGADAVAVANQLHYTEHSARKAKKFLVENGINVRVA